MSYNKKIWKNGDLITEESLNNIENGIYMAHGEINTLKNNTPTGGSNINDTTASANTTYSSNKIESIKEDLCSQIKDIENEIGSETLNTSAQDIKGAINEVFQKASNGKVLIANAITGMGVEASPTDTFEELANKILLIIPTVYGNIIVDVLNLEITEGGTGTFTVCLDQAPTNNQNINIISDNSKVTVNPSTLTFTSSNYNTTQTVTVSAENDVIEDNGYTLTLTLSSDNVSSVIINITVNDNDVISVTYTLADENDFTIQNMAGSKYLGAYIGTKEYIEIPANISVSGASVVSRYNSSFKDNTTIKGVKFQDGVQFYSSSMQNCTSVEIVDGHKKIEGNTFSGCTSLKTIKNYGFQSYLVGAFAGCTSIYNFKNVILNSGITNTMNMFSNCTNLTIAPTIGADFDCPKNNGTFTNCTKLSEITIENTNIDFGCTSMDASSPFWNLSQGIKINSYINSEVHNSFKTNMCKRMSLSNRKFIPLDGNVKNIALFGDSLTDGYSSDTTNYPTFLNQKYDNNTIVYNFGRSGFTMAQIGEVMDSASLHLNDDVVVIWGGTNSPVSAQEHLQQEKELISKLHTENYIIIGLTKDGLWSVEEDNLFAREFGNKYLNIRQYILDNWETITGLTPTEQEIQQVQNGNIPESLRLATGDTHFNTNGNKVISQGVYDKIQELGYLS